MDLSMRLKRLPLEKSRPILNKIKSSVSSQGAKAGKEKVREIKQLDNEEIDLKRTYPITDEEFKLVTETWSKGKPLNINSKSIVQLFESQVLKTPHKCAVSFNGEYMTFEELNNRANQLAYYLTKQGVKQETLVAVYLDKSLEVIISILAILKSGACYIPIATSYPDERVKQIVLDSKAEKIITTQNILGDEGFRRELSPVYIDEIQEIIKTNPITNLNVEITGHNLAYIIYTSGSTGQPKGVQIEHKSLVNFIESIAIEYDINKMDTVIQFAAIGFDVSVFDIFVSLCTGATLCIAGELERKAPEELTKLMIKEGVTVAELPPALLPLLNPDDFPNLRLISVGGEKFSGDLVKKWENKNRRFMNGYGPTETTVAVTLFECRGEWSKNPPIGKPIHNVEVYVLNENLQPQPIGIQGELYIGGACLARGYINQEEITEQMFLKNPFSDNPADRIYKTGDLVKWLPDGNLEILGRVDRQIKIRGFRVEIEEIESLLLKNPDVNQVTVEVLTDGLNETQLVAYLTSESNVELDINRIRDDLKKQIPDYMIPSYFMQISEIPMNANGKIDRKLLPQPEDSRPIDDSFVAPRNEIELKLCNEILSDILGVKHIGVKDNFFDLGGNSLQATLVVSRIREIFDVKINLIDFFQTPIIENLGKLIQERDKNEKNEKGDIIKEIAEIESSWLKIHKEPEARFRLVCFPYAGSSTYIFSKWPEILAPDIEVITVNLPGRDSKIRETPFDSAFDVANRLASEIELLADKPLIFLGQSGGSILAFETSRLLLKKGVEILRLFALASRAPHAELSEPSRYHLPEDEFLRRVNEFGGLSCDLLSNKDLLKLMIPTMRADEKLAETYKYTGDLSILPFPISMYGGKKDIIGPETLNRWAELSSVQNELKMFDGGHFFLQENEEEVISSILESLFEISI
ncbi:amino acid adenylation domain-containing protein [Rossellomorea vietnamensis]|nr:amino acid adenylation domain-containing protein [Rossellomorea vietnamensis]